MNYKDSEIIQLRKNVTAQLESITCINCCKYYLVPTTATCGHSLCQTCWRTRRSCPSCAMQVDKKALRLNSPLQTLTEHAVLLGKAFQSLFKINLDDILDTDEQQQVKEWLANSANQFSAPVTSSQQFTEEPIQSTNEVISEIQIHTRKPIVKEPEREIIQMNFQQDDWDKIEEMPEIEANKSLHNAVGPMDIEPFDFYMDDNEYNTHNLRRSSRKKETCKTVINDFSSDKESGKSFNVNTDKKSKKHGLNWKNVKRMKKEFSKLNKKNNNKLNVSIEMCKKSKSFANKAPTSKIQQVSYNIDDNTPEIAPDSEAAHSHTNLKKPHLANKVINTNLAKDHSINSLNSTNISNKVQSNSTFGYSQNKQQLQIDMQDKSKNNIEFIKDVKTTKVNFVKRGPLQINSRDTGVINSDSGIKNKNMARIDTDDIEITIKIGKTITNICIQKKDNDVKVNINSDQENQTSLGNIGNEHGDNMHNSPNEPNSQTGNHNNVLKNKTDPVCTSQYGTTNVHIQKSNSTKKNTTSADTSSAHFEITESEEKEFEDQMENIQFVSKHDKNESQKSSKSDCTLKSNNQVQVSLKNLGAITEDVEFLNDVDIFEGESVKEGNIQPLSSTANTPSAIIMPTAKSKSRSQKNKRNRDISDIENLSNNKKIKITHGSISDSKKTKEAVSQNNILDAESENINYDAIMSQVFANINADMQNLQETGTSAQAQTQISNTQKSKNKILPPPIKPNTKQDNINKKTDKESNEKCSENVFSLLEKEDGNSEIFQTIHKQSHKHLERTQELKDDSPECEPNIEHEKVATSNMLEFDEIGTPIQDDDDDKSVVEETPQKATSFIKSKNKNEVTMLPDDFATDQCLLTQNNKTLDETGQHQKNTTVEDSVNVISISDSVGEITEERRSALETPLTITKFVDKITHKSTPLARKSLNFSNRNNDNELEEETLCPSSVVAKTTQEREFMSKAFEQTIGSPTQNLYAGKERRRITKLCVAGSCLIPSELGMLKKLCSQRNWKFLEKYTKELTHLVVGVDEDNRSQRSVKYICALANAKWIISFEWVEKCLKAKDIVDEEPFEALDAAGEPGPRRSRLAKHRLLEGFTFYCMPPFTIIDIESLKDILEASGGRVLSSARDVRATDTPAMLLAEPEHTQEDRFIYLAMELQIVPVNYEWVLNCLGTYTLKPISDLLLCPAALLPPAIANWPPELILSCDE